MRTESLSPGAIAMLPLFYIGWSDSVLSPSEMEIIHERMQEMDFLTDEDRTYLKRYTDPKHPPTSELFAEWLHMIRNGVSDLEHTEKMDLAELGLHLAQSAVGQHDDGSWHAPQTLEALQSIQKTMGLDTVESSQLLHTQTHHYESLTPPPSFNPAELQALLDQPNPETKQRMRKLLRDPYFAYRTIRDKEEYRQVVLDQVKTLGEHGLGAYAFPKAYGGGERLGEHITIFEMLAYSDLSRLVKFGVQFGLFGGAVYGLGTERHHRLYLEALGKADLLGCFAMTETGHGSNVKGIETTAIYDRASDSLTIHTPNRAAGKEYIGNAMHAEMAAVFAQLIVDGENHGVHCVLVPMRNDGQLLPGVDVEDCGYKMGLNGVDNGRIYFDQVVVPRSNLLDRYGTITDDGEYESQIKSPSRRFFTMLGALVAGRISVGLASINASKSALTIAIKYALQRRQFAPKDGEEEVLLLDYPTHQRRLLPRLAATYAYYFALQDLTEDFNTADESKQRKIETKAAGLKAMASWHATATIQECREACGGKGYLHENRFADLKADTDIFTTFEGDNYVLLQLVAKGLLTEFRQSFHDEGYRAVIRYLSDRIANTATEYNPIYRRNTNANHLLDKDFHHHAFRYRENKLLLNLSQRMQGYLRQRISPFDAFLKCQVHMVELAKAYIQRLGLKSLSRRLAAMQQSPEREVLSKVADLYALTTIESNKGWYLEADYMDGVKTKAIRRMINKLCSELRYEALGLVDAFGIPDELLGAEIV